MMRHPFPARLLAVLAGALAIGACGIPADDTPRAISQDQMPEPPEVTTDLDGATDTVAAQLWFTRTDDDRTVLVPVPGEVPAGGESGQPTPAVVLDALLAGVPEGTDDAVVSKIPPGTALASQPVLRSGLLTVDLDNGINVVQGDGSRLAYGQMVCTVNGLDDVDTVRFTIEGDPVSPTDGEGESDGLPLTCDDYANRIG